MTYYTDSNQIKDLMGEIADVQVKPLHSLETWSGEPLGKLPKYRWSADTLMWHRPDWGGIILELMKNNEERVYLFCGSGQWCRVV